MSSGSARPFASGSSLDCGLFSARAAAGECKGQGACTRTASPPGHEETRSSKSVAQRVERARRSKPDAARNRLRRHAHAKRKAQIACLLAGPFRGAGNSSLLQQLSGRRGKRFETSCSRFLSASSRTRRRISGSRSRIAAVDHNADRPDVVRQPVWPRQRRRHADALGSDAFERLLD